MVDWENNATVAVPAYDLLRILILQRRDNFLEALEAFNRAKYQGVQARSYEVKARLISYYEELHSALTADMEDDKVKEFEKKIYSDEVDELVQAYREINKFLYDKKLTQFDTKIRYDSTRAEKENSTRGMR